MRAGMRKKLSSLPGLLQLLQISHKEGKTLFENLNMEVASTKLFFSYVLYTAYILITVHTYTLYSFIHCSL